MTNMVAVHLHGPLAERFGARHDFAIRTPAEAVRALDANYPGFLAAFAAHGSYVIVADDDQRDDETCMLPVSREVHFAPIIEGRAFVGAALITAIIPGISAGTATIMGGLLMAGLMMGLSMLLTPKPKPKEETTKDDNYAFTGPENVTGQGAAVPLVYGRVYCGSVVVSAGLDLGTDLTPATAVVAPPPGYDSTAVAPGLPAYPGGWPPLVQGFYGTQPQGWVLVTSMIAVVAGHSKRINIYEPSNQPSDQTPVTVLSLSNTNPARCTMASTAMYKFLNGMTVDIDGAVGAGLVNANGSHVISSVGVPANTFTLAGVDCSAGAAPQTVNVTATPPTFVYAWNERQGFYGLEKVQPEEDEWVDNS